MINKIPNFQAHIYFIQIRVLACTMVKVPFAILYVVNQVKLRRLILGISARELSRLIGASPHYVAKIESSSQKNQYSESELAKVTIVLNCSIRDLYPPDELLLKNDGSNVFKEIISVSDIEVASKVIDGMIETGYFKKAESLTKIAKHLHIFGRPEAPIVEQALNNFVTNGKLTLTNGSYIQP